MFTLKQEDVQTVMPRGGELEQSTDDLVRVIFNKVGIN
jgi:hypothetical protein